MGNRDWSTSGPRKSGASQIPHLQARNPAQPEGAPELRSARRTSQADSALQDTTNQLRANTGLSQGGAEPVIPPVQDILGALARLPASDLDVEIQAWLQPENEADGKMLVQAMDKGLSPNWDELPTASLVGFIKHRFRLLGPVIPRHLHARLQNAPLGVESIANFVSALGHERRLLVMQLLRRLQTVASSDDPYGGSVLDFTRLVLMPVLFGEDGQAQPSFQLKAVAAFMIITAGEISAVLSAGTDAVSYPVSPFKLISKKN